MTYKDQLIQTMTDVAKNEQVRFLGYNVAYGHQFNGTLVNIAKSQLFEMPVAENLIVGVAIGMAMEGFIPVVCIERMDFLWACADAIINHMDKAKQLGWGNLKVIIRACVGGTKPLSSGCQHTGDYVKTFKSLLAAPVMAIKRVEDIDRIWTKAVALDGPCMIVEYKDLYPTLSTVAIKTT
jgi:pyruvate/2-oxoglutarate/acetoin dehydrogenase E1 component